MKKFLFAYFIFFTAVTFASEAGLQEIECRLMPYERVKASATYPKVRNSSLHSTRPHMPVYEGTSTNWSGYAAVTSISNPAPDSVSNVAGTWVVPKLSKSTGNTYSSLWVGIDGYSSNSVEQLGTEHDWSKGKQNNYAWFEMYPQGSYQIVGFPVNVGDHIGASVTYQGNNIFKLSITNHTKNVTYTVPSSYTKSSSAQRSSAEWIAEAPYSNSVLPLAHFGIVPFSNCTATINGINGPINSPHWVFDALTMVTQNNTVKSIPSSLTSGGEAFTVTWKHQ